MEQQAYQSGLKRDGAFQPIKRAKFDKQRDENNARMSKAETNYAAQLRQNGLTSIRNAEKVGKDLEALSKFSKTLTDELVEREKIENEEEMQKGIMLAYTDGVTAEQSQKFDEEESALRETEAATRSVADKLEKKTGNIFVGQRVRGLSGWAAYGYALGKAQTGASDYMAYFQDAATNREVTINTEKGEVTLTLDEAETPEEYAAVQAQIRADFLQKYRGMNPALLNKYLFPGMREFETKKQLSWESERTKAIKTDRQTLAGDMFVQGMGSDAAGALVNYLTTTKDDAGGWKKARENALEIIKKAYSNGDIGDAEVESILKGTITVDGKERIIGEFFRDFKGLKRELQNLNVTQFNQDEAARKVEGKKWSDALYADLLARDEAGQYITEDELKQLKEKSNYLFGEVDSRISGFRTKRDIADEEIEKYLINKEANTIPITPADLRDASPELYRKWQGRIKRDADAFALSTKEASRAETSIKSAVTDYRKSERGQADKTLDWNTINNRAQARFESLYAEIALRSESKEAAFEEALGRVAKEIESGAFDEPNKIDANVDYGKRIQTGKQALSDWSKEGNLTQRLTTSVLPGVNPQDIEGLKDYANGSGNIPIIFSQLSSGLKNLSTFDLARAQYMASTGKDLVPPLAEEIVSEQPQWIQRYLKYKPTSARTRQAMVGSGDRRFLDLVASKESEAYGGYDAYNRYGSADGRSTGGTSGNSLEDGRYGKPVSQLTVGEIKKLHRDGAIHAVGRYQFIGGTFKEVVEQLGLRDDTVFDAATQDRMAMHRARWRVNKFGLNSLSQEWIGLEKVPQATINEAYNSMDPYNAPDLLTPGIRGLSTKSGANATRTVQAASKAVGMDTSAGPDAGNQACVYAVNKVLKAGGIKPPWGNTNYVPDVKASLDQKGTRLSGPRPGAIAIMQDNGNPPYPHIGIVQEDGTIISNSSSEASFSWVASPEEYERKYGGKNLYYSI